MGIVVSLTGFRPPARYDEVPWTHVHVFETAGPGLPWAQIDDIPIAEPDADPSEPAVWNGTTTNGTLEVGWYFVAFVDALDNVSEPSDPIRHSVQGGGLPPTPDEVRAGSPLLRLKFPIPATDFYAAADLRSNVYQSIAYVQAITFRLIDPTFGCTAPDGYSCKAVPPGLEQVAFDAVTRMTERQYVTSTPDFAEQMASGRLLRGFTAGPYSESYFSPGEFARRGAQQGRPAMDDDAALDGALWALATEDARDYFVFRASGQAPPTGRATAFDYRRQHRGYSAGSIGLMRGGPLWFGASGPDGW